MTAHEFATSGIDRPLTHRAVLAVAIPIVVSNLTTPLVGAVDTAVIGQLADAAMQGGVAIGSGLLGVIFWSFSFLRLGTSGLSAQATGAGDTAEAVAILERALLVAMVLGLGLIALQIPISGPCLWLMGGSTALQHAAGVYVAWRIWAAPFVLTNFALLGWFIGRAEAGRALLLQLVLNLTNMGVSILLVMGLHWGVPGVGAAAFIAELTAAGLGLALAHREIRSMGAGARKGPLFTPGTVRGLAMNTDIMIRSLCLMLAFATLTSLGARLGDLAVAANGILLVLFELSAYFLDGFANAAETFVGQAIGARRRDRLIEAVTLTSIWAGALSVAASLILWFGGGLAIDVMTASPDVREAARQYLPWCALTPLAGFAAFQLDGIFIGATRGRDMRNMMLLSLAVFLLTAATLTPILGNHGVWIALLVFLAVRGIALASRFPALSREAIAQPAGQLP